MVKMLVDAGLDLHARDDQGKTILELVREQCTQESCQTPSNEMLTALEAIQKSKPAK